MKLLHNGSAVEQRLVNVMETPQFGSRGVTAPAGAGAHATLELSGKGIALAAGDLIVRD